MPDAFADSLGIDELLYADDTLIISKHRHVLELYAKCIAEEGKKYGMTLNMDKLEAMCIQCSFDIQDGIGGTVKNVQHMKYLGAMLSSDGNDTNEISKRIGMAREAFSMLKRYWSHASLSRHRKFEIYVAIVLSKLLYGLESVVLKVHDIRKLNGFHASCCRRLLNIQPAFISRVSNSFVL